MKIEQEDYAVLERAVKGVIAKYPNARDEYRALGRSDKRWRWDLLRKSGLKLGDGAGMPGDLDLYAYLDDEHIDSALRKITGTK